MRRAALRVDEPARRSTGSSDEVLAQCVQAGDREALDALVERYLRPIHAVTASYLAEPADVEDAVQETFLRALNSIARFHTDRAFAPWLYQIARNVALDRINAAARVRSEPLSDDLPAARALQPDVITERGEMQRLMEVAIWNLPDQQRTAFRLHDVEGYSTAEIARIMGLTDGTVRSHVHHARRTLRQALTRSFAEPQTGREP